MELNTTDLEFTSTGRAMDLTWEALKKIAPLYRKDRITSDLKFWVDKICSLQKLADYNYNGKIDHYYSMCSRANNRVKHWTETLIFLLFVIFSQFFPLYISVMIYHICKILDVLYEWVKNKSKKDMIWGESILNKPKKLLSIPKTYNMY